MKTRFAFSVLMLVVSISLALGQPVQSVSSSKLPAFVPGSLLVRFTAASGITMRTISGAKIGNAAIDEVLASIGTKTIKALDPVAYRDPISRRHGIDRTVAITFSDRERSMENVLALFLDHPEVEAIMPNYITKPCGNTNDPGLSKQWGLTKMQVPQAWDVTKGDSNIIIAILDQGTNYNHEDLKANVQISKGETGLDSKGHDKKTNGIDDDDDGYVDNWIGWDFGADDNDPLPVGDLGHGTFVGGCASATCNNKLGVAGIAYNCHYMDIKIADDAGDQSFQSGLEAIEYAATHNAKFINCSWGANGIPKAQAMATMQPFIDNAMDHGALVVCAAGNDGANIDNNPFYPACLDRVLCVGGTDQTAQGHGDTAAPFNFGHRVNVYAPGGNIYSTTWPGTNGYNFSGGTSFASPNTAAVAALVLSKHPLWSPSMITQQLVNTCDPIASPNNKNLYWGRVNALSAVTKSPSFIGVAPISFSIDDVDSASLKYINKQYKLGVKFINIATASTVAAKLLYIGGYNVLQGTSSLGALNPNETGKATFMFTRDSTDNGDGTLLPMQIALSSGTTYRDTVWIYVPISGHESYHQAGVSDNGAGTQQLTIVPNPTSGSATIFFSLSTASAVTLTVTDLLGHQLKSLDLGSFAAGEHTAALSRNGLAAGTYIVTLVSSNGEKLTSRLIIQ
ncbi:MAG TPA: S8 family serine peptidase [Candidatus Kapabacteria bacterium]|nr:S8 family serine peptidase [Candidatus Kapabacteria bacterium]